MLISSSPSRGFLFIDPALIGNMCDDDDQTKEAKANT